MAKPENPNQEKDFLDIDLDDPLEPLDETLTAPAMPEEQNDDETGGILLYDNKKYATGLSWLIAEEESDAELAVKRAKDFKADFYTLRQNVVPQHGFGYLKKGHRIGLPALASVAADALVGEWHGVFVADNGWWYVAVHSDNIAPDGDILFTSEEAAYNHFINQSEAFRWPRTYVPESWNIAESSGEIPLNKLIGEAPAPALKPVTLDAIFSGKRNKNLALGALAVITLLIALSLVGQQFLPSLVPMQAQIPIPDMQVSDDLQAPPKEPVIVRETTGENLANLGLIRPSKLLNDCINGFSVMAVPLPGWKMMGLRCKETFVEATWTRQMGSYEMIEPYMARFPDGAAKSFTDSGTLVVTRRLVGKRVLEQQTHLYDRNHAIITLTKRFANLGQLEVKEVTPNASQQLLQGIEMWQQAGFTNLGQNKIDIRPLTRDDLPYLSIMLRSKSPPNMLMKYFDMSGVVIQSIENDVPNGVWQYDAKLILRPDQRLIEANTKAKALQNR